MSSSFFIEHSFGFFIFQGEAGEQKNGVAEGDETPRPQQRRFWRPYRRWHDVFIFMFVNYRTEKLDFHVLCHRPFRPRPPAAQAADGEQATPEKSQEQEEVKQPEASESPQTNGEAAEDQKEQRRQTRRRRTRNSESSTSKVSVKSIKWDMS